MRGLTIIHLCIVFTVLAWSAGQPFMGELYSYKSQLLLYQTVMGKGDLVEKLHPLNQEELHTKLKHNKERFSQLPTAQQQQLLKQYEQLQERSNRPWHEKLQHSLHILAFDLPAFEKLWILLSLLIALMLVFGIEGAKQAVWLLPIVVLCYSVENRLNGTTPLEPADTALFPSEKVITTQYLYTPLSPSILEQQQQLQLGWQLYLIREWAQEVPEKDQTLFQRQAEKGEFYFTLARLEKLGREEKQDSYVAFHERKSLATLALYLFWNFFYAFKVSRSKEQERT